MKKFVALAFVLAVLFLAAGQLPAPVAAAGPVVCSANPSVAELGTRVSVVCSGFDRDVIVNTYVVDPTGFVEIGADNYTACFINSQGQSGKSGKANETGTASFSWYTQNGVNTCPTRDYAGYANQIGSYTVVVQQLDGRGGIAAKGTVQVLLTATPEALSGALIAPVEPSVKVPGSLTFIGSGFVPGEAVNLWLTRPAACSGMGVGYWSAMSAFSPSESWGDVGGANGPATVKADPAGNISATMDFVENQENEMPCLGTWALTARALKSGRGDMTTFEVVGTGPLNNATVWTEESSVPSIGQTYAYTTSPLYGVGVHVHGSGFPAGAHVNCWFTRPDGTAYSGYSEPGFNTTSTVVDASGAFSVVTLTYTSEIGWQAEQPGTWFVTCATPDGKYSGTAHFDVVALMDP
ncbi:MAG: hypothetical protein WCF84_00220 [Anaerolineae bacterium]